VGTLAYGAGDMVSPTGVSLDYAPGTVRVLSGAVYVAVHLSWVAALALLLSVSTDAPLGAVGGAVMVSIVSQILDQITALEGLRMTRGALSASIYALVLGALAIWRFQRKDITS
jgi:ABC-2 type transport system permease protein